MRLLLTRPEPDATAMAGRLVAAGHEVLRAPLLAIVFPDSVPLPLDDVQALIATSRNGLRALAPRPACDRERALALQIFTVGKGTARLARETGFSTIHVGAGTAEALAPLIAEHCDPARGPLLHLAGDRLASDLEGALGAAGFALRQPVIYRVEEAEALDPRVRTALLDGWVEGVIVMSPRTARVHVRLVRAEGAGLLAAARRPVHFCLSGAVAAALGPLGSVACRIPARPGAEELLALVNLEAAH